MSDKRYFSDEFVLDIKKTHITQGWWAIIIPADSLIQDIKLPKIVIWQRLGF